MKNMFLLGECMIELMTTSSNTMKQSFAGDVFNTAVYLKRTFADVNVQLVTAVGKDPFSLNMIQYFKDENIGTDLVFTSDTKIPGLYSIQLDEQGERSFTYWRENAAARQVMQHIQSEQIAQLSAGDMFFFSGISLAVVEPQARNDFWSMVKQLKASGVQIVFDPNYRPRLWQSPNEAKAQFELAFHAADTLLPGIDDFEQLYAINNAADMIGFLAPFGIDELIIKNGPESVVALFNQSEPVEFKVKPVTNVVDTTSAGDSFNGVYLGARMNGIAVLDAIDLASKSAAFVIQHKGAIVDKVEFNQFSKTLSLS
ncbi:sugar kinase [Shewanella sp. 10N.286.52.A9]|uniref:sugar kinase n=1 Tax=Shewanella sp. 10N.286.52.A9 TaxID=3229711 RepID=UPI00354D8DC8